MSDPRWPVWLDGVARAGAVFLVEEGRAGPKGPSERFRAGPAHVLGCACCTGRGSAAEALSRLALRAVREAAFACVVVIAGQSGLEAVQSAVADDRLARARFRLSPPAD